MDLSMKQAEITFEQAISRLEEIVQALDGGQLPLNESLLLYEEGVKLARLCAAQLTEAKGRLETLVKKPDGSLGLEPLNE
jgi:exodeoxyribonuclease VII small subunit